MKSLQVVWSVFYSCQEPAFFDHMFWRLDREVSDMRQLIVSCHRKQNEFTVREPGLAISWRSLGVLDWDL